MPLSVRGIVEKLKGTKRIYLHYARNQCPNKGNAVIEREKSNPRIASAGKDTFL